MVEGPTVEGGARAEAALPEIAHPGRGAGGAHHGPGPAVLVGLGIGLGIGVAAAALAFAVFAVPLHLFGRGDDGALDGGLVRLGLVAVALPLGVLAGAAAAVASARWYARGAPVPGVADRVPGRGRSASR